MGRSVGTRRVAPTAAMGIAGCVLAGLVLSSGCDQLAGLLPGKSAKPAAGSSTTSPASSAVSADVPSRPLVSANDVVAKVNGRDISMHDVELVLQDLKALTQARGGTWTPLSPESKPDQLDLRDVVDDLVMSELRAQDALSFGRGRDLQVQRRFWQAHRSFFAQDWVSWQLDQAAITDEEIEQFYTQNQIGFREPEQIRVRQLVVAAEDQAKAALVKLLENMSFETVAQQMSLRPDAAKGALVEQWVMRSAEKAAYAASNEDIRTLLDPALEKAAFAIDQPGGVSAYVKGTDGHYHIFQLVERKPGRQKPLVEVSDTIRNFLRLQRLSQKNEELRKKAAIHTFDDRLTNVQQ